MEYRFLGKTDKKVSVIGFGGIPIQRISAVEAKTLINDALDKGINFIDTARAYTDSEEKIGKSLGNRRSEVILATKSMARTKEAMAKDIDISLRDLQTDYIDLFQLHNVKDQGALDTVLGPGGALEALKEAQKAGKVRHIGITGHIPEILVKAIKTREFATVQFPFNGVEKGALKELLPTAIELNLGTIIMKPFGGGAIKDCDKGLRFILQHTVTTAIPGMDSIKQVEMNCNIGNQPSTLSQEELNEFNNGLAILGEDFCRRCEYCLPCPQGIDIPTMFLLEGYYSRYGLPQWAIDRYDALNIKASACIQCGNCEERCPYSLKIISKLAGVREKLER